MPRCPLLPLAASEDSGWPAGRGTRIFRPCGQSVGDVESPSGTILAKSCHLTRRPGTLPWQKGGKRPISQERGAADLGSVLVTGATGFTGGHLARALEARGYRVRALVRPTSNPLTLERSGIEVVYGDLTQASDVERAAGGVHTIYHIAALFRTAGHADEEYRAVNVDGTQHVLAAAASQGVGRVVHCSTVGVHGAIRDIPAHEESSFNPGDIYQETKLEGEELAQAAFRAGVPGVVVRPAGVYGPGDLRFLKLFRAVHRRRFMMFGSGEVPYHLTYIDDLIDGLILCGEKPDALGQTYILAGSEYVALDELILRVAEAVGVPSPRGRLPLWPLLAAASLCEAICRPFGIDPPLHKRRAEFFVHPRAFTSEKAHRELGFAPKVALPEGLRRTAEWYFQQGHLLRR
jgi:dihydroflavonol-4-reductase